MHITSEELDQLADLLAAKLTTLLAERPSKPAAGRRRDGLGNRGRPKMAVEGIDPLTGEVKRRFDRVIDAKAAGFEPSNISACIHGKLKTTGGLAWRRAGTN